MKVVLAAINAKYIHSNLAVYSLRAYTKKYRANIELAEYTINNYIDDILMGIYEKKPDIVAFSCYIWNINLVLQVAEEIRKVLPEIKIWLGGPEVTYDASKILKKHPYIDGIMIGEGEQTFYDLMTYYQEQEMLLDQVRGIAFRESAKIQVMNQMAYVGAHDVESPVMEHSEIVVTEPQVPMNMDDIPFVYEDMADFKNKIIYYEVCILDILQTGL